MNLVISNKPSLKQIISINNHNFHSFLIKKSIDNYLSNLKNTNNPGEILALGANEVEAKELIKYSFKKIILSGISNPSSELKKLLKKDKRLSYKKEDMQKLSFKDNSFDLVFVKEAIHHTAMPIKTFYEMLRVSKKAIILIEPNETTLGNFLERLNLTSMYEKNYHNNKPLRDNYVYRWRKREILKILNSYFLKSNYKVIFSEFWISNRLYMKFPYLGKIFNFFVWLASFLLLGNGNYLSCTIFKGKDNPLDYQ